MEEVSKNIDQKLYFTESDDNLTSKNALKSLEEKIETLKNSKIDVLNPSILQTLITNSWTRKFIKIADYQYGAGSGMKLFANGVKMRRNRTKTKIEIIDQKSNESIGKFDLNKGQIELTIAGAEQLFPYKSDGNYLVFDGEKVKGSNLFRPGVIEFSPNILPQSNIAILDKNKQKIIAVGNAIIGSNNIRNIKKGIVAEIYEKL
jgi:predicted RNA-binding protein (TIGR00451 family)